MLAKRMGYAAAAAVAIALTAVPTLSQAKAEDGGVAAVVNGNKIYKSQVETFMKANNVKAEDQSKVYPIVLDQLVDERLLQDAAHSANIEKSAEFQQRLAQLKENLAKQTYLENYLKDKVNDKVVKAEYEKLKKENKGVEEIHARHILLKTEDEAKQVIKSLDNGAKFEDLAKERSTDPSGKNGGDIGYVAKSDPILPAFTEAAFKVKPGTYAKEPLKTQLGWHVIMVEDKRERVVPELKTVEERIRNGLAQEAVKKLIQSLSTKADIKRFGMDGKPLAAGSAVQ